jgi:hypothetical protein
MQRILTHQNINSVIDEYVLSIENIGRTIIGLQGIKLFHCLKRDKVGTGPYPNVTLFEAANRIMTDLVIMKGVKWLIDSNELPFEEYLVEYGNEDNNDHDITAENKGKRFSGEAFNVAPSFYQGKKNSMLKKLLMANPIADYNFIIVNADAIKSGYHPKIKDHEYYFFVNIESGSAKLFH